LEIRDNRLAPFNLDRAIEIERALRRRRTPKGQASTQSHYYQSQPLHDHPTLPFEK
jgi:hypothetical protein